MASLPSVSLIIPTYNRPAALRACLEAIARLDYPADRLEVIVVDDGSPAPLGEAVTPASGALDVRLLRQANAGPAAARNAGARHARHAVLAFTDDDCRPRPDWLRRVVAPMERWPGAMTGGHTVNLLRQNPYAEASQALLTYVYTRLNTDPSNAQFLTSNNMTVPRADFEAVGGFDESFRASEDRDLCARWRQGGRRIVYVPEAVMGHAHRLTLGRFWRQHVGYGRGAYHFHRRHASRAEANGGRAARVPASAHSGATYLGMAAHPFQTHDGSHAALLAGLIAFSQAASAYGLASEALRTS